MAQSWLYTHFIQGILQSPHQYFGGDQCVNFIPSTYHLAIIIFFVTFFGYHMYRYRKQAINWVQKIPSSNMNWYEKLVFTMGLSVLLYTAYRKIVRHEGLFMINPCHVSVTIILVLMAGNNESNVMRWIHTAITGWEVGAAASLLVPHLQDLSSAEIVAFYVEHLFIWPIGPLILYRRYGYSFPNLKDHFTANGSLYIYHMLFLIPLGHLTKVSINFQLCPSPSLWFSGYGIHYYLLESINLIIFDYLIRLVSYVICLPLRALAKQKTT